MTFQDMYLRSRNSALYHMLYNMQRSMQSVGPCTEQSNDEQKEEIQPSPEPSPDPAPAPEPIPEPDVEAVTEDDLKNAFEDTSKDEVVVQLAQPMSITNDPVVVPEGKTLTVDLNGNAVSSSGLTNSTTKDSIFAVRRNGTLVLEDSSGGEGVVDGSATPSIYSAVKLTEKGEDASGGTASVVIDDGTYKGTYYAVVGNGGRQDTDVTINGGTFEGVMQDDSMAIYQPQAGTMTINGGSFKGSTCIVQKSGTIVINGGNFEANGIAQQFVHNRNGWNNTGDCFVIEACDYPGQLPSAEINGGTFISENAKPVASYAQAGYERITGFVKGGTFNKQLDDDLIADGYQQVFDGEMYKVVKA